MPVTDEGEIRDILRLDSVAVIGCSATRGKAAHEIPRFLLDRGYNVVPINPFASEIFGLETVDSLDDVEGDVDIVNVFRPSEELSGIVDEVLGCKERLGVDVIWTQLGVVNHSAAERAEESGIRVVMDRCMKVEYQRLIK